MSKPEICLRSMSEAHQPGAGSFSVLGLSCKVMLLSTIEGPEDLGALSHEELYALADEIRELIVASVAKVPVGCHSLTLWC